MRQMLRLLTILLATVLGSTSYAADLTPRVGVPSLAEQKQFWELPNFRIGGTYDLDDRESWHDGGVGGQTLESLGAEPLRLGYMTIGTPETDAEGRITNAIVISSYYSGDSSNMYANWVAGQPGNAFSGGALVGPGLLFDTNRFFVVFVDAIGLWGASKPSDGLGINFPQYSYMDMVQANYRLLTDHLNIANVALATGVSMGASQTWVWGLMHSGYVNAIMPIGGTTQSDGEDPVGNWTFQLMTAAIESDPVWQETGGDYYHLPKEQHPNKGVEFGWSMLGLTGFTFDLRTNQPWNEVKRDVFYWDDRQGSGAGIGLSDKAKVFDAVDLIYRNRCGETYNINDDLHRITADVLVVHVDNDQWLISTKAEAAAKRVPGAEYVTFASPLAHYAVFRAPHEIRDNVLFDGFLRNNGIVGDEDRLEVANYTTPVIQPTTDPSQSFWRTQVTPPFPVKYAEGTDGRGVTWEIGYMDEYAGTETDPPVLVLIHGKGAFAAHYGGLMKYALERGLRVIAPDMPHYGFSGPGNLDKSPARTLQDARDAIHDVIVNQLGVERAYYHGHSLGGQFVLGYALSYPENVAGLALEAPAGLEEFPKTLNIGGPEPAPLFDPAYAHNFATWQKVWGPSGIYDAELNRTVQSVEDFFYFKKRDDAGNAVPTDSGYFLVDSEYARLHTDQRVEMIRSNRAEFEQWVTAFIYDIYSIGSENVAGDPDNLVSRLDQIEVPIFLAFGAQEPFIPSTPLNGLTDMADEVIIPFVEKMTAAGNPPVVKLYPDAAHFIHTDVPYEFAKDTVDFVLSGRVDSVTAPVIRALVHGTMASAPAAAPAAGGGGGGLNK